MKVRGHPPGWLGVWQREGVGRAGGRPRLGHPAVLGAAAIVGTLSLCLRGRVWRFLSKD